MTEPRDRRRSVIVLFLGICVFACVLRWPIAAIPLERDEGEYAYIAQRWWLGEVPYRDSFDQKPPGVFVAYLVIQKAIGTSPAAIHWGAQLNTLGTLPLIFLIGRKLFGDAEGLLAALFAAFMTADLCVLGQSANTETFMILPLTAALLATIVACERGSAAWAILAGVCGSLALLCKQVALPNVALCGALLLLAASVARWRLLLAFVLGGLLGLAPTIIYFATTSAWPEFWDCVVSHNLRYAQRMPLSQYPYWFWMSFRNVLGQWWPILVLAAMGASATGLTEASSRKARGIVIFWLFASAAGISIGGYFRGHYYVHAIPPLALLAARGVMVVSRRRPRPAPLAVTLALAAIVWGVIVVPWYYLYGTPKLKIGWIYADCPFAESIPVASYLCDHSRLDETAFVFGSEPQILYYAGRRSGSRYIFVYPLMTPFADTRRRQREVIHELHQQQPRFLVYVHLAGSFLDDDETPTDLRFFVDRLCRNDYQPVGWVAAGDDAIRPWAEPRAEWRSIPPDATVTIWERRPVPR
jgi:4-amino-4-deoxy-L-arabinose transferase-like glycosyltransferase